VEERSRRRGAWAAFALALVVGGLVRAWLLGDRGALQWQDTFDFLETADESWFSAALWAGARAPGVPVLLKLVGADLDRYLQAQAVLATIGWAALCASVASVVRAHWPRVAAVAAVLAFSLTTPVTMWERSALSESLGVTALALLAAAGVQLARGVTTARAVLVAAALVPWLVVRDSHLVVAVVGGGLALAVVGGSLLVDARRRRRASTSEPDGEAPDRVRRAWRLPVGALGAVAVVLGLGVSAGAAHGDRQNLPMRNLYAARVLPYPDRVEWFADRGMPQADVFVGADARQPSAAPGRAPLLGVSEDDPALEEWVAWVHDEGRLAFVAYVATHPDYLVTEPMRRPERTFNNALGDRSFYAANDAPHLPLVDLLLARRTAEVLALSGLAIGWMIGRQRLTPAFVAGAVLAVLALPHGAVAWHSDGMETARHLAVPGLQFHLGVLLMLVGILPAARDGQTDDSDAGTAAADREVSSEGDGHGVGDRDDTTAAVEDVSPRPARR
jgi:hypothetical protein